jgi:hypothetical protein
MSEFLTETVSVGSKTFVVRELGGEEYLYFANNPVFRNASDNQVGTHQLIRVTSVVTDAGLVRLSEDAFAKLPQRVISKLQAAFGRLNTPTENLISTAAKVLKTYADPKEDVLKWLESLIEPVGADFLAPSLAPKLLET